MQSLGNLGVTKQKIRQFNKKGIFYAEDLVRYLPRKYDDYRTLTGVLPDSDDVSVFKGIAQYARYKVSTKSEYICMPVDVTDQGITVNVYWFQQRHLLSDLQKLDGQEVIIVGKVVYSHQFQSYSCLSPKFWSRDPDDALKIHASYPKIPGMSQAYLTKYMHFALSRAECYDETIPEDFLDGRMTTREALHEIHEPTSMEALERAKERLKFDDLLYYALRLELAGRNLPTTSRYGVSSDNKISALKDALPYSLTEDQDNAVTSMLREIRSGKRLNALLQGDVGSGKTIVAFLMMTAIISSGCQAALVAPTKQLASQHYSDMKKYLEPLGISVAFYGNPEDKPAARKKKLAGLADGSIQIVVGTHALFSPKVTFNALGMVVIDEEHKFGVAQRKALTDRAIGGTHCIIMSATPIPRSLANAMYGGSISVYTIKQLPSGRKQTKTIAFSHEEKQRLRNFILYQYNSGHQTYVVCPVIDKQDSDVMADVIDIDMAKKWLDSFESDGIRTEVLTGKTSKEDSAAILERFKANETHVLLATSVIEVGINVPSATGILIFSAERFGLASLHQLRGRVGRGNDQGYCVLYGKDVENNERIQTLCSTTDGFRIAEEDLRIRGAGDFLGTLQSGDNKYVSLLLSDQDGFEHAKALAVKSINEAMTYPLLERAVADFREAEDD